MGSAQWLLAALSWVLSGWALRQVPRTGVMEGGHETGSLPTRSLGARRKPASVPPRPAAARSLGPPAGARESIFARLISQGHLCPGSAGSFPWGGYWPGSGSRGDRSPWVRRDKERWP